VTQLRSRTEVVVVRGANCDHQSIRRPLSQPGGKVFTVPKNLEPSRRAPHPPTPNFPVPCVYASNRNTGTADPRAIRSRYSYALAPLIVKDPCSRLIMRLDQIRRMAFDPAKNGGEVYLVASGLAGSRGVVVYKRTGGGPGLQRVARNKDVPMRTTFV
jgi:hypothetical protein